MGEWNFRFAAPEDAEAFTKWAVENPDIAKKDIDSALRNATTTIMVVTYDGKPVLYVPVYMNITIPYLGFNPESGSKERLIAMERMLGAIKCYGFVHGISDLQVFSKENYNVAQWAQAHGFELEDRQAFVLKQPKVVPLEEEVANAGND